MKPSLPVLGILIGQRLRGGGQNVSREFGGGATYCKAFSPKPLLDASEIGVGLVGASFLLRETTESRQKGGKTYRRWGGPKTGGGRGFTVCSPPPRVFHPPRPLSDLIPVQDGRTHNKKSSEDSS